LSEIRGGGGPGFEFNRDGFPPHLSNVRLNRNVELGRDSFNHRSIFGSEELGG
jgi:hypothetical protein